MSYKILVVASLAAVALADKPSHSRESSFSHEGYDPDPYDSDYHGGSSYPKGGSSYPEPGYKDYPKYDFHYKVNHKGHYGKKLDFGHWENRDGYVTKGSYWVLLPDYRHQKVEYVVDKKSGFVAKVTYKGDPKYPEPKGYKSHHSGSYEHGSGYKPYEPPHSGSYEDDYKPYKPPHSGSYEDDYKPSSSYEHGSSGYGPVYTPKPYY